MAPNFIPYGELLVALARADTTRRAPHPPSQVVVRAAQIAAGTAEPFEPEPANIPPVEDLDPRIEDGGGDEAPLGGEADAVDVFHLHPPLPTSDEIYRRLRQVMPAHDRDLLMALWIVFTVQTSDFVCNLFRQDWQLLDLYTYLATGAQTQMAAARRVVERLRPLNDVEVARMIPADRQAGLPLHPDSAEIMRLHCPRPRLRVFITNLMTRNGWTQIEERIYPARYARPGQVHHQFLDPRIPVAMGYRLEQPWGQSMPAADAERLLEDVRQRADIFDVSERADDVDGPVIIRWDKEKMLQPPFPIQFHITSVRGATRMATIFKTRYTRCGSVYVATESAGQQMAPMELPREAASDRLRLCALSSGHAAFTKAQDAQGQWWAFEPGRVGVERCEPPTEIERRRAVDIIYGTRQERRVRLQNLVDETDTLIAGPNPGASYANVDANNYLAVALWRNGHVFRAIDRYVVAIMAATGRWHYGSVGSMLFAEYNETLFTPAMRLHTARQMNQIFATKPETDVDDDVDDDDEPLPREGPEHRVFNANDVLGERGFIAGGGVCQPRNLGREENTLPLLNALMYALLMPVNYTLRRMVLLRQYPPEEINARRVQFQLRRIQKALTRDLGPWQTTNDLMDDLAQITQNDQLANTRDVRELVIALFSAVPIEMKAYLRLYTAGPNQAFHRVQGFIAATLRATPQAHLETHALNYGVPMFPVFVSGAAVVALEDHIFRRFSAHRGTNDAGQNRMFYYDFEDYACPFVLIAIVRNRTRTRVLIPRVIHLTHYLEQWQQEEPLHLAAVVAQPPQRDAYCVATCPYQDDVFLRYSVPPENAEGDPPEVIGDVAAVVANDDLKRDVTLLVYHTKRPVAEVPACEPVGDIVAARVDGSETICVNVIHEVPPRGENWRFYASHDGALKKPFQAPGDAVVAN